MCQIYSYYMYMKGVLVHYFEEFLSDREVHFLHYIIIYRNYMVSDLRLISI